MQLPNDGYMLWFVRTYMPDAYPGNPVNNAYAGLSPDATGPPTAAHRPEGTWGNLANEKEGTHKLSTAKAVPEVLTIMSPQMNHRNSA